MYRTQFHLRIPVAAAIVLATLAASTVAHAQTPLGTGFTYQGQLKVGDNPANGNYDFIFALLDAATNGNVVGAQAVLQTPVVGGMFNVQLNAANQFGPSAFNGEVRWLQIRVRPTGGFQYELLSPRQPLTATPYALSVPGIDGHSLNALDGNPVDAVVVDSAGKVGIGTTGPKQTLHVNGDYYGKGHFWLHAYEGDRMTGTAYVQARDDSGNSSIALRFRTQNVGVLTMSSLERGRVWCWCSSRCSNRTQGGLVCIGR